MYEDVALWNKSIWYLRRVWIVWNNEFAHQIKYILLGKQDTIQGKASTATYGEVTYSMAGEIDMNKSL